MPRIAGEQCLGRLLQTQCIERFDDPTLGTAASSEVHVSVTVEEHQHRDVRNALVAVIKSQIHRHGHRAHRSELQIEYCKIGDPTLDGLRNIAAIRAHHEGILRGAEGGNDFVQHPLRVGSHEYVHVCRLLQRRQ